jgi:hypothetical protein
MERWLVQDLLVNERNGIDLYDAWVFYCNFFPRFWGARFERFKGSIMQKGVWGYALNRRDGIAQSNFMECYVPPIVILPLELWYQLAEKWVSCAIFLLFP